MTAQVITTASSLAPAYDIIVVGAGPAGLTASIEAAANGVSVLVIDENSGLGGQMYRAITRLSPEIYRFLGPDYWQGTKLAGKFQSSPVSYASRTTVWSLVRLEGVPSGGSEAGLEVGISLAGEARLLRARHVILATGAIERPMPFPGWTLPGVMTAGAGQVALKSAGLVPEGKVVLAGCGPMLYLLAYQLLAAGARISAVLDITDRRQMLKALPYLPDFTRSGYFWKGLKLLGKVLTSVRFVRGVTGLKAIGNGKVERIRFRTGRKWKEMDADLVMLHQGVVPEISLANSAGCEFAWNHRQLSFQPRLDGDGQTTVPGISVAGDGAAIGGAALAEVWGRLAALGALADIGVINQARKAELQRPLRHMVSRLQHGRPFLDILYRPLEAFRIPAEDETIVCRCEGVQAGQIRSAIALGVPGPNQLKTFIRCGMGPCQGRLCSHTVTEMMAAGRKDEPQSIGAFRLRAPVKPISLGEVASLFAQPVAPDFAGGTPPPRGSGNQPSATPR
ncbi:MAG: NAD(P)/FAD-dependent oxidoreductase [Holophaga sp.]|nr:NAD(P)/FAD-dependent oxidoreductase [Holophaga sp.]